MKTDRKRRRRDSGDTKQQRVKKSAKGGSASDDAVKHLRPVISDAQLEKVTRTAKTPGGKRHLASLGPQVHEDTKVLMVLKGHRTSAKALNLLRDIAMWRKPHVVTPSQNQTRLIEPMDKPEDFEYLGDKNHSPIFVMASSTKKRPLRLFGGRLYNFRLYDLYEFDVVEYQPFKPIKDIVAPVMGSKPLVVFQGPLWEVSNEMEGARNFFADLYGGIVADRVMLEGFDHAYCISAYEKFVEPLQKTFSEIRIEHFSLRLKKAADGSKLPDIDMEPIGPTMVLRLARSRLPERAAVKAAHRLPAEQLLKKVKNVSTNDLLEKRAKVYINKEDFVGLHTRHGHSSKTAKTDDAASSTAGSDQEEQESASDDE